VVTISTDDRVSLEKGLINNDFIPNDALHLYTEGKRFQHPLLKTLGVQSFPQPFLLDRQGKIIATKNDLKDMSSIIELVEQYLEK
jgi:hypothetical protein